LINTLTSPEKKFSKSQELIVLVQIYNPTITPEKKFDVEATYTFYSIGAEGEKRFNSTKPQPASSTDSQWTHGVCGAIVAGAPRLVRQ